MLTDLQGQIERITYTNEESGYTIAKVKVYGRRDLVTVVGNFMAPMPGEILTLILGISPKVSARAATCISLSMT